MDGMSKSSIALGFNLTLFNSPVISHQVEKRTRKKDKKKNTNRRSWWWAVYKYNNSACIVCVKNRDSTLQDL